MYLYKDLIKYIFEILLIIIILLFLLSCHKIAPYQANESYLKKWSDFETKLIISEKSFQEYQSFENITGDYKLIEYPSANYKLKGLLNTKNIKPGIKSPILVYFHGGFALNLDELKITQKFTDLGFIVFAPSYRGENGNPGYTELFMGEIKDAKAAVNWIANQDHSAINNIYTFGWSVGGGISLGLSLHDDLPIKLGGSSAGIYDLDLIKSWATEDDMIIFPYDYKDPKENYFRLPLYILENMVRPHYSYVGSEDDFEFINKLFKQLYPSNNVLLNMIKVQGNHMSSRSNAIDQFILEINKYKPYQ